MYYVLDEKGNRVEGYDKQGFLNFLQEAINKGDLTGIDGDSAFVSKLKCCVGGQTFKMAFVTNAKYNELLKNNQLEANALYFITDDNSYNDLFEEVNKIINGTTTVPSAETATKATNAILNSDNTYSGFTKDKDNVLKTGDTIISRKVLLLNTGEAGDWSILNTPSYNMPDNMTLGKKFEITLTDGQSFILQTDTSTTSYILAFTRSSFSGDYSANKEDYMLHILQYSFDFSAKKITCPLRRFISFNWVADWQSPDCGVCPLPRIKTIYEIIE